MKSTSTGTYNRTFKLDLLSSPPSAVCHPSTAIYLRLPFICRPSISVCCPSVRPSTSVCPSVYIRLPPSSVRLPSSVCRSTFVYHRLSVRLPLSTSLPSICRRLPPSSICQPQSTSVFHPSTPVCLSLPSVYLRLLSVYLRLSVRLPPSTSVCLSIYPCLPPSVRPSTCVPSSVCPSTSVYLRLSVHLPPSVRPSTSVCPSVYAHLPLASCSHSLSTHYVYRFSFFYTFS